MKKLLPTLALLVVAVAVTTTLWLKDSTGPAPSRPEAVLALLQADDATEFAAVDSARRLQFPADHGVHPETRTEYWYFTGLVENNQGRRFGFQLMFFRLALTPDPPQRTSDWATNQIYRAYFALTDIEAGRFHGTERFSRAALGLSGAQTAPVRVWLENWSAQLHSGNAARPGFRLRAADGEIDLDLDLAAVKPLVIPNGDRVPGDAQPLFRFYLATRLRAEGEINIGDETFAVRGSASLDRSWGQVPVSRGQIALNRFVLQLDDGRELLILQLHRRDGSGVPTHNGLLINRDGSFYRLGRRELELHATDQWASPLDGTRYPSAWRLRLPREGLDITLTPYLANQEINAALRYWSGTVAISGSSGGNGHVELSGYSGEGKGKDKT